MLTPTDCYCLEYDEIYKINQLEHQIDEQLLKQHGKHTVQEVILDGELPILLRNELASRYINAGWKYVYHATSSERGEKSDLTAFCFSIAKVGYCEKENWYKVSRELN